jgi:hypothetical protein
MKDARPQLSRETMKITGLVVAACIALTACTMRGTKVDPAELATVTKGDTLSAIEDRFGQPTGTTIKSDGTTILTYTYVPPAKEDLVLGKTLTDDDRKTQKVTFDFGPDNRLESYTQNNVIRTPDAALPATRK